MTTSILLIYNKVTWFYTHTILFLYDMMTFDKKLYYSFWPFYYFFVVASIILPKVSAQLQLVWYFIPHLIFPAYYYMVTLLLITNCTAHFLVDCAHSHTLTKLDQSVSFREKYTQVTTLKTMCYRYTMLEIWTHNSN